MADGDVRCGDGVHCRSGAIGFSVVAGTPWLPTSAVLEIALEAAAVSTGSSGPAAAAALIALVLPSGLPLHGAAEVTCTLHAANGFLEVQAATAGQEAAGYAAPQQQSQHRHALLFATMTHVHSKPASASALRAPVMQQNTLLPHRLAALLDDAVPQTAAAGTAAAARIECAAANTVGLVLHPCALEAALQLEGVRMVAAASEPTMPASVVTGEPMAAAGAAPEPAGSISVGIKVPAAIGALVLEKLPATPAGTANGCSTHYAHAAARPSAARERTLTDVQLLAAGSVVGAAVCHVQEAEFRPLAAIEGAQLVAVPAAGDSAAEGAGEPGWTTDLEPWEIEAIVSEAVSAILGQPVRPVLMPCNLHSFALCTTGLLLARK